MLFSEIYKVTCHTDHVGPGTTFVAIKGVQEDGAAYIPTALKKGATKIVVSVDTILSKSLIKTIRKHADLEYVPCTRRALALLSAQVYDYPARALKIIGITGTKGKTTTSFLIEHVLRTAGHKTAMLGTIRNRILNKEFEAPLTTPQPDYLHAFFAECRDHGVDYVVMEVAAQALSLHRLETIIFDAAVFTNFSLEHSEFYGSQEDYFKAKSLLLEQVVKDGLVVLNADDERVALCAPQWPHRKTISMYNRGTLNGQVLESSLTSLKLLLQEAGRSYTVTSPTLLGTFSAYNILVARAVTQQYGVNDTLFKEAVASFGGVPGRICRYQLPNKAIALIDNAHTPSSFEAFLSAVRPLSSHIIVIFGAGGDRDPVKRPLMGALAVQYADHVMVTTDNPRSEDPGAIAESIVGGIALEKRGKVQIELDRERAIRSAYTKTSEGSLLVLLGKGPVEYQHIKDTKIPFSEETILRSL